MIQIYLGKMLFSKLLNYFRLYIFVCCIFMSSVFYFELIECFRFE
jgi:hypothetical protein